MLKLLSHKSVLNQLRAYSQSANNPIIFRQLFDTVSSTYTYLLADPQTREAVLIDPVFECFDRDVRLLKEMDLKLKYAIKYDLIKKMKFNSYF